MASHWPQCPRPQSCTASAPPCVGAPQAPVPWGCSQGDCRLAASTPTGGGVPEEPGVGGLRQHRIGGAQSKSEVSGHESEDS